MSAKCETPLALSKCNYRAQGVKSEERRYNREHGLAAMNTEIAFGALYLFEIDFFKERVQADAMRIYHMMEA
jgi:hypothetical protein